MKMIGVAGIARVGKNTFCDIAKDILIKNGIPSVSIVSFAAQLKQEVLPFLKDVCGCDVWTNDSETKADIRDFLVWYGTTWWRKRDPKRWIRYVDLEISKTKPEVVLVSDVRYPNEAEWIHSWGGFLVHISAYKMRPRVPTSSFDDGPYPDEPLVKEFLSAPNEQERINDPVIKQMSDYKLEWEAKGLSPEDATGNVDFRMEVLRVLNSYFTSVLNL